MSDPCGAQPASKRERWAWAMYDFANSGYTTVVQTTIFNAYFVAVVAGSPDIDAGAGTLLWTIAIAAANAIVLFAGPVVGAIADYRACKKQFLLLTTVGCVVATALLGFSGSGDVALALTLVIASAVAFAAGENLIAAFLPEIAPANAMGRLSGYGWGLGYVGGLLTLAVCLGYIAWAEDRGLGPTDFVPVTLWITAAVFAAAALPTFLWLNERAVPRAVPPGVSFLAAGIREVRTTLRAARQFEDLFRFLATLVAFQSGVSTVIVVAAIYAQEVMAFTARQLVVMVMVVNVTAAIGALLMGHLQDRFGSSRVLALALGIWIAAILVTLLARNPTHVWIAANLIGIAMGSSQAAGRALIGHFTPVARTGEFFGLWGLASRLSAILGPVTFGLVSYASGGNLRLAVLSTLAYFVLGLALLVTVDEARGRRAAIDADARVRAGVH